MQIPDLDGGHMLTPGLPGTSSVRVPENDFTLLLNPAQRADEFAQLPRVRWLASTDQLVGTRIAEDRADFITVHPVGGAGYCVQQRTADLDVEVLSVDLRDGPSSRFVRQVDLDRPEATRAQ